MESVDVESTLRYLRPSRWRFVDVSKVIRYEFTTLHLHLPWQIDSQKLPRLSPSPGKRHDRPVTATEWPSRSIWAGIIRCIGINPQESTEALDINRLELITPSKLLVTHAAALRPGSNQKKVLHREHECLARGPTMPQNENGNCTSARLETQNSKCCTLVTPEEQQHVTLAEPENRMAWKMLGI